jgi:hypothetical protein
LHRTNIDIGYDQGYGSERSPEDELPPPLPMMLMDPIVMQQQHEITVQQQMNYLEQYWNSEKSNLCEYDFITQGKPHSREFLLFFQTVSDTDHIMYIIHNYGEHINFQNLEKFVFVHIHFR